MKVIFKQRVTTSKLGSSSEDVWLSYLIEVPFLPPVGMIITEGAWEAIVGSLAYAHGNVIAFCEAIRVGADERDELIEDLRDTGWEIG